LILERSQHNEKALVLALVEAYLQGISTRKMKAVTKSFMGKEFSYSLISRFASSLDVEMNCWRVISFTWEYQMSVIRAAV